MFHWMRSFMKFLRMPFLILITIIQLVFPYFGMAKAKMIKPELLIELIAQGEFTKIKKNLDQHLKYQDKNKTNLLMIAAQNGNTQVIDYLINQKINLQAKDRYGVSALGYAIGNEQFQTAKKLIKLGISIDSACREDQKSLLICAIEVNSVEVTQLILDKNPKLLHQKDQVGNTPLHVAADTSTPKIIDLLIKAGADLKAKNKKGETPYDLAKQMNLQDNMKLLTK